MFYNSIIKLWIHLKKSSYYGYYQGGSACTLDPLTSDYSHKGWIKVAAGDSEFQKSLGCGMCVEIKGQGILAELAEKGTIPKTPIIGPVYAFVIDRCGNCKQGKMIKISLFNYIVSPKSYTSAHILCKFLKHPKINSCFGCLSKSTNNLDNSVFININRWNDYIPCNLEINGSI